MSGHVKHICEVIDERETVNQCLAYPGRKDRGNCIHIIKPAK